MLRCLRRGSEDGNYGTVIIKRGPLMKAMNIAMDRVSVILQGVHIVREGEGSAR